MENDKTDEHEEKTEKRKKILRKYVFPVLEAAAISFIVFFCVNPVACRLSEEGIELKESDYEYPVIESFEVQGEKRLRLVFSEEVTVKLTDIEPDAGTVSVSSESGSSENSLCFINLDFSEKLVTGQNYTLLGKAMDKWNNSLTFSLPFKGKNLEIPELEMVEVHADGRNSGGVLLNEYVILKCSKSGNLSGIEILSVNDGEGKAFILPSCKVQSGELITVHLRKSGEGSVSETGNDLNLSTAKYSSTHRDLWNDSEDSVFGASSDVILLINSEEETVLDCVAYSKSTSDSDWKKAVFSTWLEKAVESGVWDGTKPENAVNASGLSYVKSLLKTGKTNTASSWAVSKVSL